MALSDDRLDDLSREMVKGNKSVNWLASKIEAEVLEELREAHAEEEAELAAIRALEPVAWINEEQTIGPNYGKKRLSFEPFYSCNPLHYKHTPLYTAPPQASQPGAEPVAWLMANQNTDETHVTTRPRDWSSAEWVSQPLYTAPQPAQPQQKPTSIRERWNIERDGADLLVCFNQHNKGEKCEYQRFVPAPQPTDQSQFCAQHRSYAARREGRMMTTNTDGVSAMSAELGGDMPDAEKCECQRCCGKGWNWEEHQVAERKSDVQTIKVHCEKCEGTGYELG